MLSVETNIKVISKNRGHLDAALFVIPQDEITLRHVASMSDLPNPYELNITED